MFHKALKNSWLSVVIFCISGICVAQNPQKQSKNFDPELGFKPAQTSLTSIFRQMAESLERHGHPGPYLRHIKAEHERISAKYRQKLGKEMPPYLPGYMTDEYIADLCKNWDELAPNLKLEKLAKKSGRLMRLAINGEDGKGTSLVLMLNFHQDLVYEEMVSAEKRKFGFEQLKTEILNLAENGESSFLARRETKLSAPEIRVFQSLIEKPKFTKADFAALEKFYDGPHDKLSEYGKALLSERVHAGQSGKDVPPSDGEKFSKEMFVMFQSIFDQLTNQLPTEESTELQNWIRGVVIEMGRGGSAELELGIIERDLIEN